VARRVDFYHLTRGPAPMVVARLAERVLAGGDRLLVVAAEREAREALDAALWSAIPESFLPHPPADHAGADLAMEPIVIAASLGDGLGDGVGDGASMAALADGLWRDDALAFARTLFLFDGQGIDDARTAWRTLSKREDVECHYWKQDNSGRWREGP
jgi:DNA polymerase III subunit chi